MKLLLLLCAVLAAAGRAQDAAAAREASLAAQRASVEKQRNSVRSQVRTSLPVATHGFFTAPWAHQPTLSVSAAPAADCDPVAEDEIGPVVEDVARKEGLTPDLLRAVIEKESAYLPCAISPKGAQGLMQLMPDTAAELGVTDPFDARQNVGGGARMLKQLLEKYSGNLVLALAAYNAGPGRVDSAGGVPAIPETIDYVSRILGRINK